MKLKKVRIRDFKCIEDSEEFSVEDVTCLVGKNEAGKTAILEALYKLNPDIPSQRKFIDLEYPRSKWRPNMDEVDLPKNALLTIWELEENDIQRVNDFFDINNLFTSNIIRITKGYNNKQLWTVSINEEKLVNKLIKDSNLPAPESNKIRNKKTVKGIIETLNNIDNLTQKQNIFLNKLNKMFKRGDAILAVIDILEEHLPKFLYFDEYYILPGQVALFDFNNRKKNNQLEVEDQVFEALLSLAGTSPESINNINTFERLRASLEAVSNRLSEEIFEYWSQNVHLEVTFSFDHARPNDPPPYNKGYIFRTAIKNRRHKSTVSFDERSSGFVWFFSFLVWFSQVRETYGDNLVILLDEPALNLHARAQEDIIRYINECLRPDYQVIYTTHSPFMVDPDNLKGTRTVEDVVVKEEIRGRTREKFLGTKVSEDILSVDPDTISPLQGALGYNITQTLFIGKYTLLVEGPSDLLYINWFSNKMNDMGRESLDERWTICPVGGIDKVGSFAALFSGNELHISVLVDFQKGQKGKVRSLKESNILKSGHVYSAEMFVDQDEADIEDIIGRDNYISLVNSCYGLNEDNLIPMEDNDEPERVIEKVEKHMRTVTQPNVPNFNHYKPSMYLVENSSKMIEHFPNLDDAIDRFEKLFKELNNVLP
ncbi:MAG: AAA family ATPase [Halanaerobiales bacterium]